MSNFIDQEGGRPTVDRAYQFVNLNILNQLNQEFGGGVDILIEKFLQQIPKRLKDIEQAVEQKKPDQLAISAHKVKGTAATFGAEKLSQLARELESVGSEGEIPKKMKQLKTLKAEIKGVKSELSHYLKYLA